MSTFESDDSLLAKEEVEVEASSDGSGESSPATAMKEMRRREISFSQSHQGPLPPPATLVAFNKAHPDAAETIIKMAVEEQQHRHQVDNATLALEKHAVETAGTLQKNAQRNGTIIMVVVILVGGVLSAIGRYGEGVGMLLLAAVNQIASILGNRRDQKRGERESEEARKKEEERVREEQIEEERAERSARTPSQLPPPQRSRRKRKRDA